MSLRWRTVLLTIAVLVGFGYTPAPIKQALTSILYQSTGIMWQTVTTSPAATSTKSLKTAILNVTADFDEVCAQPHV
jgi:hypothetical protein